MSLSTAADKGAFFLCHFFGGRGEGREGAFAWGGGWPFGVDWKMEGAAGMGETYGVPRSETRHILG